MRRFFLLSERVRMFTNYLDMLPEELYEKVIRYYFQKNICPEINNIVSENKWIQPSTQLCSLCQDHGCLQLGENVDNTMLSLFDTTSIYFTNPNKCNCRNCLASGWPCLNCAIYPSETIGITCMWDIHHNYKEPIAFDLLKILMNDKDFDRFKLFY